MKRAGFTMIELIFVIVILGILAAVALPRFIGVSEQAEAGKCDAFIGTLNRTVLPVIWSAGVLNNVDGNVTYYTDEIERQMEIPLECMPVGTANAAAAAGLVAGAVFGTEYEIVIGDKTFEVNGTAPTRSIAPVLQWRDVTP